MSRNDYFSPSIASEYEQTPPSQTGRLTRTGGLNAPPSFVDSQYAASPKKASFMDRMNGIAPGPFEIRGNSSNQNVPSRSNSSDDKYSQGSMERPGTALSHVSNGSSSMAPPRLSRKNGYGGFGPPPVREIESGQENFEPTPFGRAGTFPKQNQSQNPPSRTPSAPGERPHHIRQPSRGPDTSRKPPPRTSLTKPNGVPNINLADEFGIGNPYHNSYVDSISGMSMYSASSRPSHISSRASNLTTPSSVDSFSRQQATPALSKSGADLFDSLMNDLQDSMDQLQPHTTARPESRGVNQGEENSYRALNSPLRSPKSYGKNKKSDSDRPASRSDCGRASSKATNICRDDSYDWRESPLPSPTHPLAAQGTRDRSRDRFSPQPSPTIDSPGWLEPKWARPQDRERVGSESRGRDYGTLANERPRDRYTSEQPCERRDAAQLRSDSRSRPNVDRNQCRSCGLTIKGKSISSADGRLSGKYHKACFVCTTCHEPFTGTTFYVHNDKPYCDRHYHRVNGSLCGKCKRGIEGEYLADEDNVKYHPDHFRCGDCGDQLRDGYFDVHGMAYCEKDAWRRVQKEHMREQQQQQMQQKQRFMYGQERMLSQPRHERQHSGGIGGLSAGPRAGRSGVGLPPHPFMGGRPGGPSMGNGYGGLAPPSGPPRLAKRMTRLGIM